MAFPKKGANPFKGKRAGGKAPKALPKSNVGEIPPPSLSPMPGGSPAPLPPAPGVPAPGGPAQSLKAAMLAKMLAGGGGGGGI